MLDKVLIKGGSEYALWINEILNDIGIISEFENGSGESLIFYNDKEINLDKLYWIDYYPRLMSTYEEMGEEYKNAEGLVLGLSYARDSIDCKLLSKKFVMLANSAQDIYYDSCCLKYYYDKMPNIKYVIHNFSPFSLRYDESRSHKKEGNILFYYTMYEDMHNCNFLEDKLDAYKIERAKFNEVFGEKLDWGQMRKLLWSFFFTRSEWKDPSLEDVFFDPLNISYADIETTLAQYNKPYPKTIEENKRTITEMYTRLASDNVKVLIYFQPMNEYYQKYWNIDYYYEVIEFAKELKEKFDCKILDLTFEKVPLSYYRDIGHMNLHGKRYISSVIDDAMRELYYE